MQLSSNIGYLIQHLAFTMGRQNNQVLQERLGIGYSQFKILMVLERNPHIQQSDIAEALGQTEASISRQIKALHERNLLRTQLDENNRRKHLTTLTDKGVRMTEAALKALNSFHAPLFEKLDAKQQQQLLEILNNMHGHVCAPGRIGACKHHSNL